MSRPILMLRTMTSRRPKPCAAANAVTAQRKESLVFFAVLTAFLTFGLVSYIAGISVTESYDITVLRFFVDIGLEPTLCLYGILACVTFAFLIRRRSDTL